MTSEIIIANRHAVAMATDSAITMSVGGEEKVSGPARKLFSINGSHNLGMMFYGNANLMGIPWKVIIGEFKNFLDDKPFDELGEYSSQFLKFLNTSDLFSEKEQKNFQKGKIYSIFNFIQEEVKKEAKRKFEKGEDITKSQTEKLINNKINKFKKILENGKKSPAFSEGFEKNFIEQNQEFLEKLIKEVFEKAPLSEKDKKNLKEISALSLSRFSKKLRTSKESGVVFAGYGKNEMFPSVISYTIEGVVNGKVKYYQEQDSKVGRKNSSFVIPFAQDDMVCRFMEGVDPEYDRIESESMTQILKEFKDLIIKNLDKYDEKEKKDLEEKIDSNIKKLIETHLKNLTSERKARFVDPITTVVSTLPEEKLASMAEALVNITSFKKKVSLESETVGEPIDVGVISKSDGFKWVNKHTYHNE